MIADRVKPRMSDQVICQVIEPVVASQCRTASHAATMLASPEDRSDD